MAQDASTLHLIRAQVASMNDDLERLLAAIDATLAGYPAPVLIDFTDLPDLTDIHAPAGAVFHVAGGVG